ncbi:MAG: Calcineurin-like phosphoesterase [Candidatus Methanofastidiosum methylothiophilum]|uniref:Calcineurin-like phosphoesterase n=1 Tax=Candidatus Methanofastidiosum methylothiophilum TaxID=1705564 RepID=A0A150J4D6_9EURY|nr:MAG: Calcineurin-like phosphoesterase [Candidatus Methanofastidiosum methylthiophilus]
MNEKVEIILIAFLVIGIIGISAYWIVNKNTDKSKNMIEDQIRSENINDKKNPDRPASEVNASSKVNNKKESNNILGKEIIPQEKDSQNAQIINGNEDFGSILLGVPTENSVILNIIPKSDVNVYLEYAKESNKYDSKTGIYSIKANNPNDIILNGLSTDTEYFYRILYKSGDGYNQSQEHSFHTARQKDSSFTFAIEADPHLDEQSDPEIYRQTLRNILSDNPDFLIDLGDTFMSDKLLIKSYETIEERHILLRQYFDIIGADVPLFLVLGNHEGESGWELNGREDNIAVWASIIRKQYYPNPVPNDFYSGNSIEEKYVGLREDYYAFEWGDALFVVIDPYWYTQKKPSIDGWEWTLGIEQYDWLKKTLEGSDAKYKFVFTHHLVGGDDQGRGGIEKARFFEWGGYNPDGSYGFDTKRAGWGKPIHQLLVENGVDAVFHGHDHFFAKQELDGVIYQLVPQPSHPGTIVNTADKYGYFNGDILGGSGYLRVTVSPSNVKVDYVRSSLGSGEDDYTSGVVVYSYTIS